MGLLDVPGLSKPQADARYQRAAWAHVLAGAMRPIAMPLARPAVLTVPPTVAFTATGSSAITTAQSFAVPRAFTSMSLGFTRLIGQVPTFNTSYSSISDLASGGGGTGVESDVTTDVIEYFLRATAGSGYYWVWVDDQPATAAPVLVTTTTNTTQRLTVTFPGVESHRLRIYLLRLELKAVNVGPANSTVAAPPKPVRFMVIGDSLTEGATLPEETVWSQVTWALETGRQLDWEMTMNALGGTGYLAPGPASKPFTYVDRLAAMAQSGCDFFLFKGSVNDDGLDATGTTVAAQQCYQTIYDANPNALILVSGPDQTGATSTTGTARAANRDAVKAAALSYAGKNVIGFIDPAKTPTGGPTAWVANAAYNTGDRVSFLGAMYEAVTANSSGTFSFGNFRPLNVLRGTGFRGSVQNNGNRDRFVLSDNVHWSLDMHKTMGGYFARHIRAALTSYAKGTFYLDV